MPKKIEKKLKEAAKKKGFKEGSEKSNKYIYGTMKKIEKKKGKK